MPTTPNYGWITPTEFGDIDLWGGILNQAFDDVDAEVFKKLNRDGSLPLTANWDVGGFKVTNLGNATVSGDAVHYGQLTNIWDIEALDPTAADQFIVSAGGSWTAVAGSGINAIIGAQPQAANLDDISGLSPAAAGELIHWDGANYKSLPVGTDGQVLEADSADPSGIAWKDKGSQAGEFLHVQHRTNGAGGSATSGAWRTRTLDTVAVNTITGASLAANQITLPAGTYRVTGAGAFYESGESKTRLRNITDSTTPLIGIGVRMGGGSANQINSIIQGHFTIADTKVFEFEYRCAGSQSGNGLGVDLGLGEDNIHSDLLFEKIA